MRRVLLLAAALLCLSAGQAEAILVYERPAADEIVAARDGGAGPHVIAHGGGPIVSPDGRRVIFFKKGDLWVVDSDGEHARRLLRDAYLDVDSPGKSWSPDSRYALAGYQGSGATFLFDVKADKRRLLGSGDDFGFIGATFGLESRRIVFAEQEIHGPADLVLRDLEGRRKRRVAEGRAPIWGPRGLAFDAAAGLKLKPRLREPARLLRPSEKSLTPIDWSREGDVLLVARGPDRFDSKALFVRAPSGETKTMPPTFSDLTAISNDGKLALGVVNGDVVRVNRRGRMHVLARNARFPSWTK